MTNIIEIINLLNKDGYNIDIVITDGKLFIGYKNNLIDCTTMHFSDMIHYVAHLIEQINLEEIYYRS